MAVGNIWIWNIFLGKKKQNFSLHNDWMFTITLQISNVIKGKGSIEQYPERDEVEDDCE